MLNLWVLLEFVYCVSFKYNFCKCLHEDPFCGRNACMDKIERRINCTVLFKTIYYELPFLMIVPMMKILVQNRKHFYWFADLHFWFQIFFFECSFNEMITKKCTVKPQKSEPAQIKECVDTFIQMCYLELWTQLLSWTGHTHCTCPK